MPPDKTVRRRRVALGLLVGLALILLTASFGNAGGIVSSIQRGAQEALAPLQEGASVVLKPVRDLFAWVGDTVDATGENEQLRAQLRDTRRALVDAESAAARAGAEQAMAEFAQAYGLERYRPVEARVIVQSPQVWSSTISVDADASDGVNVGDAVIAASGDGDGGALVGTVTRVTSGTAKITLITDQSSQVGARINQTRIPGVVSTAGAGDPRDLLIRYVPASEEVEEGMRVVTAGTVGEEDDLPSLFPPLIPIGEITRIEDPGSDTQEIHLEPYADLQRLETVRILTASFNDNR
ncbi:MAG TPA: rod shape-determining protein MreC [Solirubrobacteraceae bacterium]|nr:rod shape-determining protein MreC [Solirubrobacteraceae bacterium]